MMPFKPVILWTDALIFVLLTVVVVFALRVRAREHLLAPWRRVAHSPAGMVAATVLLAYLAIGLLDSLHYRPLVPPKPGAAPTYSAQVQSAFDAVAAPLRAKTEKTYSAPFAMHLFAKETFELPDGRQMRDFPRLKFGGAHLKSVDERASDIAGTAVRGAVQGGLLWLAIAATLALWYSRRKAASYRETWRNIWLGGYDFPWRSVLVTLALLLVATTTLIALSAKYHVLGTDKVGQDVLYLSLKSVRTGLVIGTLTTLVMLPFALAMGLAAGYFRGWIDDVIQYIYTVLNSIPSVLLIAAAVLMMQVYMDSRPELFDTVTARADVRLLFLCIILGITSWTGLCRLLRGETLKLREMEYIQAAQAFGVGSLRILTRHVLPNVMHIVLISVVLDFSGLVLAEAVLSYVGVGVDPTTQSWGNMINGARLEMAREPMVWWSLASAFVFMFVLVLAANLFSDAVRDAFDPRVRVKYGLPKFLLRKADQ